LADHPSDARRSPYIADEQSISREHGVGHCAAGVQVVHQNGNRLGSVPRRFQRLETHAPKLDSVVIAKRGKRVPCFRRGAEIDRRAHPVAQLQMPGDEIGVQVRQEDVLDGEPMFGGKRNVLVDVALRVNDGCRACRLVSNEVGRVRQAWQVELLEDQPVPPSFADNYFG